MNRERWQQVKQLLDEAIAVDETARPAFLDRACNGDAELRREVESLLSSHDQAGTGFLKAPVVNLSDQAAAAAPARERRIGAYEITQEIGHGGMGEVFRARDTRLQRDVAIKILPTYFVHDAERLRLFEQEARAAASLNHPHICTVHDLGDHHGRPFFVMELLEGQSLNKRIAGKPIPIAELLNLASQICDALQAAHERGIIHRDIKPANIFLSTNGQIKILDFGVAKLVEETHSTASATCMPPAEITAGPLPGTPWGLMGTPAYLSPEQARGEEVDARTDIFSFGLVLYEMATGQRAFRGKTSEELINAILYENPVKPSTLNPELSANLERIILRALEKERSARYQSSSELLHDLSEFQKAGQRRKVWMTRVAVAVSALLLATAALVGIILSKNSVLEAPNIIQRQITSNPVNDSVYAAAISRDGKELAYTDLRGVHVRAVDTGDVHDIPIPPGLCFR